MAAICAALGHPEQSFRSVIVAGTNGKGSVTAMTSAALHAAGYRSARYTSPHLERIEERFVIGEREVDSGDLEAAALTVQTTVERLVADGTLTALPTFFECATAIAFELFRARLGRAGGGRGRARRPPGRDQRHKSDGRRHHVDRLRSPGSPGRDPGIDRSREGRRHQAGDTGHCRTGRPRRTCRHRGDVPRARSARSSPRPNACASPPLRRPGRAERRPVRRRFRSRLANTGSRRCRLRFGAGTRSTMRASPSAS